MCSVLEGKMDELIHGILKGTRTGRHRREDGEVENPLHILYIQRDKFTCTHSGLEGTDNGLLLILIVGSLTASLKAEMC